MVKAVVYRRIALDDLLAFCGVADAGAEIAERSARRVTVLADDVDLVIRGVGLDYASGHPSAGTVRSLTVRMDGERTYQLAGLDLPARKAWKLIDGSDPAEVAGVLFGRADILLGSAGADTLGGFGGADAVRGRGGGDTLLGGNGSDTLKGGGGEDRLDGGRGRDLVDGGAGDDTADYSAAVDGLSVALAGARKAKVAVGGRTEDRLARIENVECGAGDDRVAGDRLANVILGGAGADRLEGGEGDDTLAGGPDGDILVGGAGADRFVFDQRPDASEHHDQVVDFVPGADLVVLASSAFSELPAGSLAADAFVVAAGATRPAERVIYDARTGALLYDRDGAGGDGAVPIAVLPAGLDLGAADFLVA